MPDRKTQKRKIVCEGTNNYSLMYKENIEGNNCFCNKCLMIKKYILHFHFFFLYNALKCTIVGKKHKEFDNIIIKINFR